MANRKKEVYKPKPMTEGKRNLIQGLLQEYDIQSADDIHAYSARTAHPFQRNGALFRFKLSKAQQVY